MLGTRRIMGVAIDLWVGHPSLFDCDKLMIEESDQEAFAKAYEPWLKPGISSKQHGGSRHLALVPPLAAHAEAFLKSVLGRHQGFTRITLILPTVERHGMFLEALEAVFPEE